ncbi:MAG: alkaline phosphatase family protein [Bacteroidia bacterium]
MKGKPISSRILLIGWDAADWKTIRPLMDAGYMPTLRNMMNNGASGRLATLDPPLSPILWTSIATGKLPYKHGIHGFTEPKPDGTGIRPITSLNRKTKAFWNILSQEGYKVNVIGWWPSHPAEKINGTMISNFYQKAPDKNISSPWSMMRGTVHPEEKADFFARLRIHPGELTEQHILPFVPGAAGVNQNKDRKLENLAGIITECSTIQAAATYILEREEWDVTAVYFDAIDHFCHGFMRYHPPRRPHISAQDYELYKDVVAGAYRYHDMMLERLLQLAGPETTVILISDHGFHANHLRPEVVPREPSGPAAEHSPYGIICMQGPGIKKGVPVIGAGLLDITPTLLSLLGLPTGRDMDGKVLVNVMENPVLPTPVLSWDTIEGNSGMHPPGTEPEADIEAQALEQLIQLGYVEAPGENAETNIQKTVNENSFYLARSFLHTGQPDEAVQLLEKLHESSPEQFRYGLYLIQAYIQLARPKEARAVFEEIREILEESVDKISVLLTEGRILLSENKVHRALKCFREANREAPKRADVNQQLGWAFLQLNKWEEAKTAYKREIETDPENAGAWHGLGVSLLRLGKPQEAAENILKAIELMYHTPVYHLHLGEALFRLEQYEVAAEAFSTALRFDPQMNHARWWLANLYEKNLNQPEKAREILSQLENSVKGTITIVSGLPRSGTSLMMQMLKAGGMEIFTDDRREADENNPQGYYEHEAVKRLARDKKWLPLASGKAVKVIAQLLQHLPASYHYKVIFMERDIREVSDSQQKMLERQGKLQKGVYPYHLQENLEKTLREVKQWQAEQLNMEICIVSHRDLVTNPFAVALQVNEFLKEQLAVENMALVVKPELYRENYQLTNPLR